MSAEIRTAPRTAGCQPAVSPIGNRQTVHMQDALKQNGGVLLSLLILVSSLTTFAATTPLEIAKVKRSGGVDFEREVLPFLRANCLACHNRTGAKAGLIIETPADMLKGGDSGPAIVPKKGAGSLLLKTAAHQVEDMVMPPRGNKANAGDLTPEQLGLLKLWIDQGAKVSTVVARQIQWQPLPTGLNPIYAVAATTDGQFAAASRANQIFVYQLPTSQLTARLTDGALNGVAHRDQVNALAFNPEGTLLASGSFREIKLWRRPLQTESLRLTNAIKGAVTAIAASSDGKTLALAGADGSLRLWNRATGKQIRTLQKTGPVAGSLQFSPDGQDLAAAGKQTGWSLWSVEKGKLKSLDAAAGVIALEWLENNQLLTATTNQLLQIWTPSESLKLSPTLVSNWTNAAGSLLDLQLVSSPTQKQVIALTDTGIARQWTLGSTNAAKDFPITGPFRIGAIRPDGQRLLVAGTNAVARLQSQDNKPVAELKGDRRALDRIAEKDRALITARAEQAFQQTATVNGTNALNAANERIKKATEAHAPKQKNFEEKQKALAAAQEAKTFAEKALADLNAPLQQATNILAMADTDAKKAEAKQALDKLTNESRDKLKQATDKLAAATKTQTESEAALKKAEMARNLTDDELRLSNVAQTRTQADLEAARTAFAKAGETLKEAEAAAPKAKTEAADAEKPFQHITTSPDGRLFATINDNNRLQTWSAESGAAIDTYASPVDSPAVFHFISTNEIALGGKDGRVVVWNIDPAWQLYKTLGTNDPSNPLADRVNALQFSPDGKTLASAGGEPTRGGDVQIWDVTTGKLLSQFRNIHSDAILSLDFSPDGTRIATGGSDKFARIVDVATGKVLKSLEGHTHHVMGVSFKSDGRQLVTAGADNVLKTWDVLTGDKKK
ncbi:MAG TPA: c-type cytochrome domain-containing protein, partial [Roseimicrobium sp.]|nr:c-type cytochrome domain-containing protein [Roseimicrobium sp.]